MYVILISLLGISTAYGGGKEPCEPGHTCYTQECFSQDGPEKLLQLIEIAGDIERYASMHSVFEGDLKKLRCSEETVDLETFCCRAVESRTVKAPPTGILIVATGDTDVFGTSDLSMEVRNASNGQTCQKGWPKEFPIDVEESSGGLLSGRPVICGGYRPDRSINTKSYKSDLCYTLDGDQHSLKWKISATMRTPRNYHSIISLENPSRLWVIGGSDYDGLVMETEYVHENSSVERGPDLHHGILNTCVVRVDDDRVMLIGGSGQFPGEYTNKTWVFSQSSQKWREGPELNAHRTRLGCGKMYSAFHNKDMIIAIGGFGIRPNCDPKADDCFRYGINGTYTGRRIVLDSVEMIDPENLDKNPWQQGPPLPNPLYGMTVHSTGSPPNSLMVIGGHDKTFRGPDNDYRLTEPYIHELSCEEAVECKWTTKGWRLGEGRVGHVSFLLKETVLSC